MGFACRNSLQFVAMASARLADESARATGGRALRVVWSRHAKRQAIKRFDRIISIPFRVIKDAFMASDVDVQKVHWRGICFVCGRDGCEVTIVTLYRSRRGSRR